MAVNVGVIKLAYYQDKNNRLVIEDNIGESIHLHYNNIRIDFTVRDFLKFSEGIINARKSLINQLFNSSSKLPIDKKFFEDLKNENFYFVEYIDLYLKQLLFTNVSDKNQKIIVDVENSEIYKSVSEENQLRYEKYIKKLSQVTNDASRYNWSKFNILKHSIKINNYDENNLIVVRNIKNSSKYQVMDGQHRAVLMFHIFGNIKIRVARFERQSK